MKYEFRVVCSEGAKFLTKEERSEIANNVVQESEKLNLAEDSAPIFNDSRGLKIVVRWTERELWIMTVNEAMAGGLPSPSDN